MFEVELTTPSSTSIAPTSICAPLAGLGRLSGRKADPPRSNRTGPSGARMTRIAGGAIDEGPAVAEGAWTRPSCCCCCCCASSAAALADFFLGEVEGRRDEGRA